MPLPTLIPAAHAPIWESMLAWLAKVGALLGCTAATTVETLKRAYLAADRRERSDMCIALMEVEYMVRRLLVAAALALRLDPVVPPVARPAARDAVPAFDVMPASAAPDDDRRPPTAEAIAEATDRPDTWLRHSGGDPSIAHIVDADAEHFARSWLALARVLADPDTAIRALARRFIVDPRQAASDVFHWDRKTRGDLSSSWFWTEQFETVRAIVGEALSAFRVHVEPG